LDLTLGQSSVLLGSAILLDALQSNPLLDPTPLREFGETNLRQVWAAIDAKPQIAQANIDYLGIAHGWAGILYATLQWCRISGTEIPPTVEQRLDELAALTLPTGRGLEWHWILGRPGEPMTMAGWCNGTCGYVFLWTLAHRSFDRHRYLELAHGAALRTWDADEPSETLCCGLAGRGYALLNMYRASQDTVWVDRARDLVGRAMRGAGAHDDYAHSLYKGKFGLAVLAAELQHPEEAATPFFEPMGYQS
jgi:serine/threonine-protein kinase